MGLLVIYYPYNFLRQLHEISNIRIVNLYIDCFIIIISLHYAFIHNSTYMYNSAMLGINMLMVCSNV